MAGTVSCPRYTSTAGWAIEQRSTALGITRAVFLAEQCAWFDQALGIAERRARASTWRVVYVVSIEVSLRRSAAYG